MYKVITVDNHGREKLTSEWLSGSLAVDAVRATYRTIGHALRDIIIVDSNDDLVFSKLDLELESLLREH